MARYPLIIFGAGASYDSIDNHSRFPRERILELDRWQPPLTNSIFDRTRFNSVLDRYPDTHQIAAEAYQITESNSFEDLLTNILEKLALRNARWYRSLVSLKFYLQDLFRVITITYGDYDNNYYRILASLERNNIDKCCIVNFNYDLLLENNIPDIKGSTNVNAYIAGPIKVIKIHGAYNWFRSIGGGFKSDADFKSGKDYALDNAEKILKTEIPDSGVEIVLANPEIKNLNNNWEFYEDGGFRDTVKYFIPDLALPINKKRDFVCPQDHIDELRKQFSLIDTIIIIGWKAADEFLCTVIEENIGNRPIIIISPNSGPEIRKRLLKNSKIDRSRIVICNTTFTDFILNGICDKILSANNMDALIQDPLFS